MNRFIGCLAFVAALLGAVYRTSAEEQKTKKAAAGGEAVFELEEVSVFAETSPDVKGQTPPQPVIGMRVKTSLEPDKQVKAYPKLQSKAPRYGTLRFGTTLVDPGIGPEYRFVVDESGGTGKGYDRLYFDANADLDLTNDPVLAAMAKPPSQAIVSYWKEKQIIFDGMTVPVDFGPGVGMRPQKFLARLVVVDETQAVLFCLPTVERKGKIRIGRREYAIELGGWSIVSGRYDLPGTEVRLKSLESPEKREDWWDSGCLGAMREVDGQLYTLSATPRGDRLIVRPYQGEFGVMRIEPGNRDIKHAVMHGALRSAKASVQLKTSLGNDKSVEMAKEFKVPSGNYLPSYMTVEYGNL